MNKSSLLSIKKPKASFILYFSNLSASTSTKIVDIFRWLERILLSPKTLPNLGASTASVFFDKKAILEKKLFISKRVSWTLISLLIIVPLGLYSKFYSGQAARWVNDSLGGVLYVIFWCLFAFLLLGNTKPWKIATAVFTITCLLEFLQLWHPPLLEFLRSYFLGRTLLGTSFTWNDFPYYFVGCGMGWLWIVCLQKIPE